jgi:glycerophosphoryl diester phosphodiesterase
MLARLTTALAAAALIAAPASLAATPDIHAHRGGTILNGDPFFGEETLAAYRHAARHAFVLEVDAKLTEDRVPVAVHDATLDRTTNCRGEVRTYTLAELARCRTKVPGPTNPMIKAPAPPPARILTVRSVLEFAKRTGSEVNLEIKNVPTDSDYDSTPAFANRVMDVVRASRIPRRQLLIQSFLPAGLDVARQRMPGVATSLLAVQAINEPYLQIAADNDYDFISPEWPVTAGYVRRAHSMDLDVAPFTLNERADVRAARRAGADVVITDDPLMAARAMGMRPARAFDASAFIEGRRLFATGDLLPPRGVTARQGCRGTILMRIMIARRVRLARGRLNRNCEFRFGTLRTPPRLGAPLISVLFEGNRRVLPELEGPERARLVPPTFNP